MARQCKNRRSGRRALSTDARFGDRPLENENPQIGSVNTLGSGSGTTTQCVRMRADIGSGKELLLLVDTGADISILKPDKLDKTKRFDPKRRVRVKGVSRLSIQMLGAVQVVMYEGTMEIPFTFQLVGKQVDIPCDGILGRDFLTCAGANIC